MSAAILLAPFVARARNNLPVLGAGAAPAAAAGYTGPIDVVASPVAWWGLMAGSTSIAAGGTQKLVNIRRAVDSETCDVLVATSGGMGNTTACSGVDVGLPVATFCLATSCFVTKIYDQSGNGNDASNGTTAQQPALTLSCVNSLPCMTYTRVSSQSLNATITSAAQPFTFVVMSQRTTNFANASNIIASTNIAVFNDTANLVNIYAGSSGTAITQNDSVWHALSGAFNGASSVLYGDAVTATSNPGSSATGTSIGLSNGGNSFGGLITEGGYWGSAFTPTQQTNMCRNQQSRYAAGNFGATC